MYKWANRIKSCAQNTTTFEQFEKNTPKWAVVQEWIDQGNVVADFLTEDQKKQLNFKNSQEGFRNKCTYAMQTAQVTLDDGRKIGCCPEQIPRISMCLACIQPGQTYTFLLAEEYSGTLFTELDQSSLEELLDKLCTEQDRIAKEIRDNP